MAKHVATAQPKSFSERLGRIAVILGAAGLVLVSISGVRAWIAYQSIERVSLGDAAAASELLGTISAPEVEELREAENVAEEAARSAEAEESDVLPQVEVRREFELLEGEEDFPFVASPPLPDEMFTSYLLVGVEGGFRADAIIYLLMPEDGSAPIMASLPRDLYLPNPCTKRYTRINAGLVGCKDYANGPELLSLMVRDFTGIEVDHFAKVNFSGFQRVIDALGGVEICVDNPVRDAKAFLNLPAGCTNANGAQALAWVRSRRTEEFVNGRWRRVPGVSDFTRQEKEQEMLFKIAGRLDSFASLASFAEVAESLADTVALDSGFSFRHAVSLAWSARGMTSSSVERIGIETDNYVTPTGAYVLLPLASFNEQLAEVYPPAAG